MDRTQDDHQGPSELSRLLLDDDGDLLDRMPAEVRERVLRGLRIGLWPDRARPARLVPARRLILS